MSELSFRVATDADKDVLLRWRNDPVTRKWSRNHHVVRPDEHEAWFADAVTSEDRLLVIIEADGVPVAVSRYDRLEPGVWECNVTVGPEARGNGFGADALTRSEDMLRERKHVHTVVGMVHEDNVASRSMLRQAGYFFPDDVPPEPPFLPVRRYVPRGVA